MLSPLQSVLSELHETLIQALASGLVFSKYRRALTSVRQGMVSMARMSVCLLLTNTLNRGVCHFIRNSSPTSTP